LIGIDLAVWEHDVLVGQADCVDLRGDMGLWMLVLLMRVDGVVDESVCSSARTCGERRSTSHRVTSRQEPDRVCLIRMNVPVNEYLIYCHQYYKSSACFARLVLPL
jgi:hypothetical protein